MQQEVKKLAGRDYSISLIRFLAFLSIVLCHILQYFDHPLAFWFNVGVQIFLAISGYLYSRKAIPSPVVFYKKQFLKILIPFWIVLIIYFLCYRFILHSPDYGGLTMLFRAFFAGTTLPGSSHLWFVGTILVCYLITPLLPLIFKNLPSQPKRFATSLIVISITTFIIFWSIFPAFYAPSWVVCYLLGYAAGYAHHHHIISFGTFARVFGILSAANISQIILTTYFDLGLSGFAEEAFFHWCDLNHVWLGLFLFFSLKLLFSKIAFPRHRLLIKICRLSDSCSYEAYLVHQFFILFYFSLMAITPFLPLNLILIILAIIVATIIVKLLERPIFHLLKLFSRAKEPSSS